MKLYRVRLKVKQTKYHPGFHDFRFGYYRVWLFADSTEDAEVRARKILGQLPYESMSPESSIIDDFADELGVVEETLEETARRFGIAISFDWCKMGSDEDCFLNDCPA